MKSYHREFQPLELGGSRWFFPILQFEAPKALIFVYGTEV
jgi:hypothetical protein